MSSPSSQASSQPPSQTSPKIAIVGGGMVGMSLALLLAKQASPSQPPLSITLIEQLAIAQSPCEKILQPSFDARSTALSAGSIPILDSIACWQTLKSDAQAINTIHISDRGHYGSTLLHDHDHGFEALGYVVENRHLGHSLLSQLHEHAAIECLAPAEVVGCEFKKDHALLHIEQDEQVQQHSFDLVIIADGAQSSLRQAIGIDANITRYQQSAMIANVELSQDHQGIAYERFTEQGPLALLPLSDCENRHRAALVWTRNTDDSDRMMSLDADEFMAQLQSCFGYRADYFSHIGERHCYPLELVEASEQVRSRVVVMGNAAHFLHPVAGQGFNLSLRDSQVLADVLQQAHANQEDLGAYTTLANYIEQRQQDQQLTIGLTHSMVKMFSNNDLSTSVLRQLGLLGLQSVPAAKSQLARQMMGVA